MPKKQKAAEVIGNSVDAWRDAARIVEQANRDWYNALGEDQLAGSVEDVNEGRRQWIAERCVEILGENDVSADVSTAGAE